MLKNKKILIALVPILLFGAYTMTKPKPAAGKPPKIKGTLYVMPSPFLLNLSDGRYAKLTVGLQLAPGQSDGASAAAGASSESTTGTLPEEPLVREIVTNVVTGSNGETLISASGRHAIKVQILHAIDKDTDVKVAAVLMPELTVQ
jgi:flagellar basal body-associated protein FliL